MGFLLLVGSRVGVGSGHAAPLENSVHELAKGCLQLPFGRKRGVDSERRVGLQAGCDVPHLLDPVALCHGDWPDDFKRGNEAIACHALITTVGSREFPNVASEQRDITQSDPTAHDFDRFRMGMKPLPSTPVWVEPRMKIGFVGSIGRRRGNDMQRVWVAYLDFRQSDARRSGPANLEWPADLRLDHVDPAVAGPISSLGRIRPFRTPGLAATVALSWAGAFYI